MFFLKKLLSRVLFPVPLCVECLGLGLLLWRWSRWKRLGRMLVAAGFFSLLLFGYPALPNLALGRLEGRYPAQAVTAGATAPDGDAPRVVMVLGSGLASPQQQHAPGACLGELSLQRLAEGVRQSRLHPQATLLVSVPGTALSKAGKQRLLEEVLAIFGLPASGVNMFPAARDTEDEILWCRRIAGTNTVLLVSCASHLPRAMRLAARHGLRARPCPSGYWVEPRPREVWTPDQLFPSAWNFHKSERAAYEYLGLVWEELRDRVHPNRRGPTTPAATRSKPAEPPPAGTSKGAPDGAGVSAKS